MQSVLISSRFRTRFSGQSEDMPASFCLQDTLAWFMSLLIKDTKSAGRESGQNLYSGRGDRLRCVFLDINNNNYYCSSLGITVCHAWC